MSSNNSNNPLAVYCSSCGAPASYDIIHQNYHCQYCGATTGIREPVQRLGEWRDAHRMNLLSPENTAEGIHSCSSCGAQVIIPAGEAMGHCEFCGGQFVRRAFATSDELPEIIIPFVLTEEEARDRLKAWATENKKEKEAQTVLSTLQKLSGYYLPYELIRGPVTAEAERMETYSDRKYHCGGFLNGIAVNTSKQLDNLVLDAMEPFEWTAARPFDFSYIAGQRVKLTDVGAQETEQRVLDEVMEGFRPEVERVLQTTGVTIKMQSGNILRLPTLLPVYVLKAGPVLAVVNGQTGRVAVSKQKQERVLSWLIEPTVLTLCVGIAFFLLFGDMELVLMSMLVFGLIFFTAFSDGRGEEFRRVIFKTKKSRAERVQSRLNVTEGENTLEDTTTQAVFFERVNGEEVPVKISFYTMGRIIKTIIGVIVFNGLPAMFAYLLDDEGVANYAYNGVWMTLTVPVTIIFWVAFGRIRIYNYPILHRILPDGRTKTVTADNDRKGSLFRTLMDLKDVVGWKPILIIIFFLMFMFMGTVGAILTPD